MFVLYWKKKMVRLRQYRSADCDGQNGDDRLRNGGHAAVPALRLKHGRFPGHVFPMGLRQPVQVHLFQSARPSRRPARSQAED